METSIISKNDVRESLIYFYYGISKILSKDNPHNKIRDLKNELKQLLHDIKIRYQNSQHKDDIRKALKEEVAKVVALADDIAASKRFSNGQLLYDIFDGIPQTQKTPDHRAYDLVVKRDPERTIAWIFAPMPNDVFDPLKAQIDAEQDFDIPCIDVKVIQKQITIKQPPLVQEQATKTQAATNAPKKTEILGKVLFSRKDQYILRSEYQRDEVKGYIYEEFAPSVKPLDILVLENDDHSKKFYARVSKIDMNPLSGGGYVHQFSEVVTHVVFRPLMEVAEDWSGRPRPSDLTGFIIRRPSGDELNEVLNIPVSGIPIARLDYDGTHEVFNYPLKPEDTIYQSVLVAGVQGKGKSNFVKLLIRSFATYKGFDPAKLPAIVILDGEGEYKEFTKKANMSEETKQFLKKYNIDDVKPRVYTVSDDPTKSNATLTMRGIDRHDIVYLMPELESKTENILRVLINHVSNQIKNEKAPKDIETFRSRLLAENNNSQLIHMQQRPAIARAVLSPSLNLLDQKDKIPLTPHLLFRPGTVSVIDYQGLDQNMKRVVALYLLQLLDNFKMNQPNLEPGVLLVIDEAELLFPENPSKVDKDYVLRIAARMEDITNRGRKRKYGVALVTHLPTEVSRKVGDLANTKIAFGCSGAEKWIRNYFGREYVDEINNLPTGKCRISIKISTNDQGPINARLDVPYVGDKNALTSGGSKP